MRRLEFRLVALAAAVLLAGAFRPVHAQDADDMKRAVARISLMDGQVSVRRGDSGEWVAGIINAPLMAGDYIATAPNSRAEVQLDATELVRIGANAEIHFTQLEYGRAQMEVGKGTVTYRVLRPSGGNSEVDTPAVSARPSQAGVYRITVAESGETEITARSGNIEVFTPRGSQWISAGQTMMARGSASDPEFQIVGAIPMDDWDRWNDSRDRIFMQPSPSARYIDPGDTGMYGTEDLDANGSWVNTPDYGWAWHPTVAGPGWAPYTMGRWVWLDWYGWTWVSADPWGWAPYHYGRWFFSSGFGWCWYPGARGIRHFWSPALVAWFGFGNGAGFGFGFGNVGWVPLAPFEVFHPWWGRGFYGGFNRNINITNVNITNVYRNARVANGVSGMPAADLQRGRFTAISRVSSEQVRTAGLVRGQMPVAPTSANLRFSERQSGFTPQSTGNQRFFSHQQAVTPQRIPFSQQQRAMGTTGSPSVSSSRSPASTAGRQFGTGAAQMPQQAARPSVAPETNTRPGGGSSAGWRRFGEPAAQVSSPQAAAPRNPSSGYRQAPAYENTRPQQSQGGGSGWQRFGSPGASAPAQGYNAPRYSAPQAQPRYNAPSYNSAPRQSAPGNGAPRSGGGGSSGPRSSGGGGSGSRSSGNNGGHHR